MRSLTKKQIKALEKEINNYYQLNGQLPKDIEDLPNISYIDNMHPCEVFWQNVNNFIWDKIWNNRNSAPAKF